MLPSHYLIRVKERLPDHGGSHYKITEPLKGAPGMPIRAIAIDTTEIWRHGKWYLGDECWKVLYWAKSIHLDVPQELVHRPRARSL